MNKLDDDENVISDNEDTNGIIKSAEKKVEKIKKNKNIKKSEILIRKTKKKLIECDEKIESMEEQLNDNINSSLYISNISEDTLHSYIDKMNDLGNKIDNINKENDILQNSTNISIEEGIKLYQEMNQIINLCKKQLDEYKMKIQNI